MTVFGIVTLAGFSLQPSKSLLQTIESFQSSKRVVFYIRVNSVSKKCRRWDACASVLSSHHRISAGLSIPEPSSLPYGPVDSAQLFFAEPPNMSYEMPIRKLSNLTPPWITAVMSARKTNTKLSWSQYVFQRGKGLWGIYCTFGDNGSDATLTYDDPDDRATRARRVKARCNPSGNHCAEGLPDANSCNEYSFATTKEADQVQQINRCVPQTENSCKRATVIS